MSARGFRRLSENVWAYSNAYDIRIGSNGAASRHGRWLSDGERESREKGSDTNDSWQLRS